MSAAWSEAGFARQPAETWRQAGWSDPRDAAAWCTASPQDEPHHLHSVRDAGYTPDQLERVGRQARRHVAAWTAAIVAPASGGVPLAHRRAEFANLLLDQLEKARVADVLIDLRDPPGSDLVDTRVLADGTLRRPR